jgi:hypothetical protein
VSGAMTAMACQLQRAAAAFVRHVGYSGYSGFLGEHVQATGLGACKADCLFIQPTHRTCCAFWVPELRFVLSRQQ